MAAKEEPAVAERKARPDLEDASELQLGPEFGANTQPLFLSEVSHLLSVKLQQLQDDGSYQADMNVVLKKSVEYAQRFDAIQGSEQAVQVRSQLSSVTPALHPFEIAQLASLVPKDSEEAKAIIPSLAKSFEDDELNEILKNLDTFVR